MYLLRTCFFESKSFLEKIETALIKECLEQICNVKLDTDMRQQFSLPVKMGGLGIMNASIINSGAYLSSVKKCRELIGEIVGDASTSRSEDEALSDWRSLTSYEIPADCRRHLQNKSHGHNQFSKNTKGRTHGKTGENGPHCRRIIQRSRRLA